MEDYQTIGREAILDATNHQLEGMKRAGKVVYDSPYADPFIFEMALKRIGEIELAKRFVLPVALENIVKRVHCKNHFLTAIIGKLENGDVAGAKEIETSQRNLFYLDGAGYVDPHFRIIMKPFDEVKLKLRQDILENGIKGAKEINPNCHLSLTEGVYALYANLALGQKQYANKILDIFFNLYHDKESGLFLYHSDPCIRSPEEHFANVLRGMNIANDPRLKEMYPQGKEILMEGMNQLQKPSHWPIDFSRLCSIALCFENFNEGKNLAIVREKLSEEIPEIISERGKDDKNYNEIHVVGGDFEDPALCRIGLALTGLEKGKPNYFYAT